MNTNQKLPHNNPRTFVVSRLIQPTSCYYILLFSYCTLHQFQLAQLAATPPINSNSEFFLNYSRPHQTGIISKFEPNITKPAKFQESILPEEPSKFVKKQSGHQWLLDLFSLFTVYLGLNYNASFKCSTRLWAEVRQPEKLLLGPNASPPRRSGGF